MANNVLSDMIETLERLGFADILLPFMLVFTIIFAVLEKTKILGDEKRNLNVAIAIIMGAMVIIPHVTNKPVLGYDPVVVINTALPTVSLLVVAVISLMILIGVFAHDKIFLGLTMPGWIAFGSIIAIFIIFGDAAGWFNSGFNNWLDRNFGGDALSVLIMLLVFGVIIAFITSDGSREKLGNLEGAGFHLGELFGKK